MLPAWQKKEYKSTILFTYPKRKINNFLPEKQSPQSNVDDMKFYGNFSIEYSLIGIVKTNFTRRNKI